jgi:hypothetical protein
MVEIGIDVLRNTLMITCFVIVIMLFIEFINVLTQGSWSRWLGKYPSLQVVIAAVLGLIPGCFGGFAVVGMWTHGVVGFGALLAAMISSVGDEAFVMLVQMPDVAFLLFGILLVIALAVGILVDKMGWKVVHPRDMEHHLVVHTHEHTGHQKFTQSIHENFKNPSFTRMLLITGFLLFIFGMGTGFFGHEHGDAAQAAKSGNFSFILDESWFNGIFLIMAGLLLVMLFFVDDHFLEEHLWKHIIRQHIPKIFLWTLGALTLIHFLMHSVELTQWVADNPLWVLLFAVLIGFVPESGPHLVFISLFLTGQIPFSILLANSITQDGHSTLPLLAESKRGFISVKLVNGLLGILAGLAGYFFGF